MTKPRDLSNSVNPDGIKPLWIQSGSITDSRISTDAGIMSSKLSFQSTGSAVPRTVQAKLTDTLSVKDFGAKGDGIQDDTQYIQAALDYANSQLQINGPPASLQGFAVKAVLFPHGTYRITSKLSISGFSIIRGDECRIRQDTPGEDIFASGGINPVTGAYIDGEAYWIEIEGVTFVGGRRHLVLANPNMDGNQMRISKCTFLSSGSYAMDVKSVSGQLVVSECKFANCRQLARLEQDMKQFSDCWFNAYEPNTLNGPQIINSGGTLYFHRCLGVPGSQDRAYWVADYQNHVQMYNCRWGDEGGSGGWPLIHAFGAPDSSTRYSPAIVIRDCYTGGGEAGGRPNGDYALVWCTSPAADGQTRVPPVVVIDNVTKVSSPQAIGTDLSEAEFNAASALHSGLRYYSVNGVQTEAFGRSSFLAAPVKQRALRRTEVDLQSPPAAADARLFRHFISPQLLTNFNSVINIRYSGEAAGNGNAKVLRVKLDNATLPALTYTPVTGSARTFFGDIQILAFDEYSALVSHRVTDQSGVQVSGIEFVGGKNFVDLEYALDLHVDGVAAGDMKLVMLELEASL